MSYYNLDETSPKIKQPTGLNIKLRSHQLTSIAAMKELESQAAIVIDKPDTLSGVYKTVKFSVNDVDEFTSSVIVIETNTAILADKVGSGKTFMIIGLILNEPVPKVHNKFMVGTNHFTVKMISTKECCNSNLIVVPHNLINQWNDFLQFSNLTFIKLNTISDFDVFFDIDIIPQRDVVHTTENLVIHTKLRKKRVFKKTLEVAYERRRLNATKVAKILRKTNAIVLNINRYKLFKQIFKSVKWARVIIDEMDTINIPTTFDEYGNFNWFLTATPTSIFYKSCKRYVNKIFGYYTDLLQYFVVKNTDEYINKSILLPSPHVYIISSSLNRTVSAIQDFIPASVMQLINSGNMKEAIAKLNCNVDTEENITKVLTNSINKELHNLMNELKYTKKLIPVNSIRHEQKIVKLQEDIKRCETRLTTINERINSIKSECCCICSEEFDTPTIMDCCKNVFCLKCLIASLNTTGNRCPTCRHDISYKDYHVIQTQSQTRLSSLDKADILEMILKYIARHDKTPRILIFSDYPQTFNKIVKNIASAGLKYALISGVPTHITNVTDSFNAGDINILLLDSKHYGSGLNLQSATYLILYHRMLHELEVQVIGRAQRFGRDSPLKVIYLVNEAESKKSHIMDNPQELITTNQLSLLINSDVINVLPERVKNPSEESSVDFDFRSSETIIPIKRKPVRRRVSSSEDLILVKRRYSSTESDECSSGEVSEESSSEEIINESLSE